MDSPSATDPATAPASEPSTPETDDLLVEARDGALWLTMNRPDVFNALSDTMGIALCELLEGAVARDDVHVVVLAGSYPAFSAGADLSGENAHERFDVRAVDLANRIVRAIVNCPKPVVAAVDGVAAGVGCSAAIASDLVVASERSSFLLAFARVGLMPDGGASATVAATIGRARAMRMALLAEPLPARTAFDVGLISHVVPDDEHQAAVASVVRHLVGGAPLAQTATKRAVNATAFHALEDALERERTGQSVLLATDDFAEGVRGFQQGRRPEFRGE